MKVVVWSKYHCPYCDQAKSALQQKNITFEERKIGDGWTKEELFEHIPAARTLPQIVINGDVIGGFNDLKKLLERDNIIGYGDGEI